MALLKTSSPDDTVSSGPSLRIICRVWRMLIEAYLRTEPERLHQARENFAFLAGGIQTDPTIDAERCR